MGWGTGAVATWSLASDSAALGMAGPISLGTFALATPLMAAAATPSRRAVELSDNALGLELRRRPRYWMLYGAGLGVGLGAIAMSTTDAVPWWVTAGTGAVSGALFTGAAAGFARDARWIRRQAPELHGRPRMMVVPLANGLGLRGRF